MKIFELDTYVQNMRLIGVVAIVISVAAWAVELAGLRLWLLISR